MRIFKDCMEMIKEVERDLAEMGIEYESLTVQDQRLVGDDRKTKELSPYAYTLVANEKSGLFDNLYDFIKYKKNNENFQKWIENEAIERLNGLGNPGEAWKFYKEFWGKYLRNEKFSYTYTERIGEQIDYVIEELFQNHTSRQVVLTIYDRHQDLMNWRGLDRVPCSLSYHFLIRNNKLNLIYSQRSCDFVNFFQADVYFAIHMQMYIADILELKCGNFTHFINSLHVFKKDIKEVF